MLNSVMMRMTAIAGVCFVTASCGSVDPNCASNPRGEAIPTAITLSPGMPYIAAFAFSTCDGRRPVTSGIVYRSKNATVASIDSITGLITARSVGSTEVYAYSYPLNLATPAIEVTVQ